MILIYDIDIWLHFRGNSGYIHGRSDMVHAASIGMCWIRMSGARLGDLAGINGLTTKGKSTGNHRFSHEIWDCPIMFPLDQSIDGNRCHVSARHLCLWSKV